MLRYDRLDTKGRMTSAAPAACTTSGSAPPTPGTRVIALSDEHHIAVAELATGEVLSTHPIVPNKTYWRSQTKEPGRRPSSRVCP